LSDYPAPVADGGAGDPAADAVRHAANQVLVEMDAIHTARRS
jgi:hypothetical protein